MMSSPIWISLKTALAATAITFVFGILIAHWRLKRKHALFQWLDALLMLPIILPPTVVGLFLVLTLNPTTPMGKLLEQLNWQIVFHWPANVLAASVIAFPLMYQTSKAALQQLNPHYLDIARLMGCSEWKILTHISLPIAWPGIAAGTILTFIRALGEFGATMMIAGNIPGRTQTIPLAIFFAAERGDHREAITLSLVVVGIGLAFILLFAKLEKSNYRK